MECQRDLEYKQLSKRNEKDVIEPFSKENCRHDTVFYIEVYLIYV